jgi:hypothetical protein
MRPSHCVSLFGSMVLGASSLAAQGKVWVVDDNGGPGIDFTSIQPAVDAAADGDTLLIKPGSYKTIASGGVLVLLDGKGLTLIAEAGATHQIYHAGNSGTAIAVRNLSASQRCVLRGLRVYALEGRALEVSACAGSVWVDNCSLVSFFAAFGLLPAADAAVYADAAALLAFSSATIQGGNAPCDGLRARDSNVVTYASTFTGGGGPSYCSTGNCSAPVFPGGHGIHLLGGFLFGSAGAARGGAGAAGCSNELWQCCSKGAKGGSGLVIESSAGVPAEAHLQQVPLSGGSGGKGGSGPYTPSCANGSSGPPYTGPLGGIEQLPELPRAFSLLSPVRAGQSAQLTYSGQPDDLVIAAYTLGFKGAWFPPFQGFLLPGYPPSVLVLGTTASGALALDVPFAPFPAGLDVLHVSTQAFAIGAGGAMVLGAPSQLSVLNQVF